MITRPNAAAIPVAPSEPPRSESSTIAPHPANTSANVASPSARQRRASDGLAKPLADQSLHAFVDLVADTSNGIEVLTGRIVERPVLVPLARIDRARISAAHRDDDVRRADDFI